MTLVSERPLRRGLVEAVVIVGSILIAFGIDAWWDGRQDRPPAVGRGGRGRLDPARVRYLRSMELYERFEERRLDDWESAREELDRYVNLESVRLALLTRSERDSIAAARPLAEFPAGELRAAVADDFTSRLMEDEVHRVLARMNRDKASVTGQRRRMREASARLLAQVEAELVDRGSGGSGS